MVSDISVTQRCIITPHTELDAEAFESFVIDEVFPAIEHAALTRVTLGVSQALFKAEGPAGKSPYLWEMSLTLMKDIAQGIFDDAYAQMREQLKSHDVTLSSPLTRVTLDLEELEDN